VKVRVKFTKEGHLRFLGHLDMMRYFQKTMRRARIPVQLSYGYNPHMIMSFASPLGLGLTSEGEYLDIELHTPIASEKAVAALNATSVPEVRILSFRQIPEEKKHGAMAILSAARYRVSFQNEAEQAVVFPLLQAQLEAFLAQDQIMVEKESKRSKGIVDIKPMIRHMHVDGDGFSINVAAGSSENLKPSLLMEALCHFTGVGAKFHYHRLELYAKQGEREVSLESLGEDIIDG